jgi:hypothetical protein
MLMLRAVRTFSASSSLSPPYLCSNASTSEREDDVLVDLNIRLRRGAFEVEGISSGRAECEDVRRTVEGGVREVRADPIGWRGEGVVMDAELDVSGESMVGNLGARDQLHALIHATYVEQGHQEDWTYP